MERTLIVFLVSNQTVPNAQFAKWYRGEHPDLDADLLFVSTAEMEKRRKSALIRDVLDMSDFPYDSYGTVEVDENSMVDMKNRLKEICSQDGNGFDVSNYARIVLNMTGGTKIMSLAAFQFFSGFENCEIFTRRSETESCSFFLLKKMCPAQPLFPFRNFLSPMTLRRRRPASS